MPTETTLSRVVTVKTEVRHTAGGSAQVQLRTPNVAYFGRYPANRWPRFERRERRPKAPARRAPQPSSVEQSSLARRATSLRATCDQNYPKKAEDDEEGASGCCSHWGNPDCGDTGMPCQNAWGRAGSPEPGSAVSPILIAISKSGLAAVGVRRQALESPEHHGEPLRCRESRPPGNLRYL